MSALLEFNKLETLADLQRHLGDIPTSRIRLRPTPGSATTDDVLDLYRKEKRLFELVEGVLVEKAMGLKASLIAMAIGAYLIEFVYPRNLGLVAGEAGMMRLTSALIRIPDVSFISWSRIPGGKVPQEPVPQLSPDLAVEVLSEGNTPAEMKRKRREYFDSGVSLVWLVDPEARTVVVYSPSKRPRKFVETDILDAGDLLPGFTLSLTALFAVLDRAAPETEQSRKKP